MRKKFHFFCTTTLIATNLAVSRGQQFQQVWQFQQVFFKILKIFFVKNKKIKNQKINL